MSGLVGIVRHDGAPIDGRAFASLWEQVRSQGGGRCRSVVQHHVALGVSRFPVPGDPFCGENLFSLDGETWVASDARLDDREPLLTSLKAKDERVQCRASDAELILRSYRVWGEDCVEHLLGDFAFAIWDAPRRKLFCARDHFGLKPFYYSDKNRELVFSNTLRAIQQHPNVSDRLNEYAIGDFLLFDLNRDLESSYLVDLRRLPPAHSLVFSDGVVRTTRYWQVPIDDELRYRSPGEYVEHFRELLRQAVRDRMRARRVGIMMSGGMDSTAVAATAAALAPSTASVKAFSTVYDRILPDDERYYATLAAGHLGIPISFQPADDYGFYERSESPHYQPPEPQNTPFYALWMDQFRRAARFSPVALHGNGGDEILEQRGSQIFSHLRSGRVWRAAAEYVRFLTIHGWLPRVGLFGAARSKLGFSSPWEPDYPSWLDPAFEERLELRSRWEQETAGSSDVHPRHPEAYRLLQHPGWPATFESFHPGATGSNLEVRHPLLDVRLARFCLSLPTSPWMEDKGLLRAAMKNHLPSSIIARPKTPLQTSPEDVYIRRGGRFPADLHPEVLQYVDGSRIRKRLEAGSIDPFVDLRPLALSKHLIHSKSLGVEVATENSHAA